MAGRGGGRIAAGSWGWPEYRGSQRDLLARWLLKVTAVPSGLSVPGQQNDAWQCSNVDFVMVTLLAKCPSCHRPGTACPCRSPWHWVVLPFPWGNVLMKAGGALPPLFWYGCFGWQGIQAAPALGTKVLMAPLSARSSRGQGKPMWKCCSPALLSRGECLPPRLP